MASISQELSDRFRRWEERTRGGLLFSHPVAPEPPFSPFPGHYVGPLRDIDDGRRPTVLSTFVQSFWAKPSRPASEESDEQTEPTPLERIALTEFPVCLPKDFDAPKRDFQSFVRSLAGCQDPVAFELIGTSQDVTAQFAVGTDDKDHFHQQLRAFFPEIVSIPTKNALENAWQSAGPAAAVIELGLKHESVLLLAEPDADMFVAMVGALSDLAADECGILQVLWQAVSGKWSESLVRSVTDAAGKPFFVNAPELADAARRKTALPLFAAVVRMGACSGNLDRTWKILERLASGLSEFSNPNGNQLTPLRNDDYPYESHLEDLIRRQSRRSGMLLNADELVGLVHLPSSSVRSTKFRRLVGKSKSAPSSVTSEQGVQLGWNEHAGERREVRLTAEQRVRHMHLVGASGTGKSTLLFNLIRQDIESGQGVGALDPHGDLIDQVLGVIPAERIKDVVLIDPSDEEYSVGFNILSAHSDWEKNLLAADLVSVFRRLSTSWGDQMDRVLANSILAFLESERGGTLLDLRRFLVEPGFREKFLATVRDPEVVYYWRKGFTLLSGNKSVGPVLTRLETFLAPKPIRCMVAQRQNRIDFGDILDSGKIFLAKLSQGALGKDNSHLLGSLFVAKFQQLAMSRQRQTASQRRDFWLYVDEFQDFITPSMAEMLVGTRKYRVGLILAHQELRQVQRDADVAGALSNAFTRVCFRVGDSDARVLASGFSFFEASDLQNLEKGSAVCRVERADHDFNLAVSLPDMPPPESAAERRRQALESSRSKYAKSRSDVEAELRAQLEFVEPPNAPPAKFESADAATLPPRQDAVPPNPTPPSPKEVREVQPPPPVPAEKPRPLAPADLGRGGAQHQAVQLRIKDGAAELGFRVVIEKPVLDGAGTVDLVLERSGQTLACEVTVTNTIDYEVGNVARCIKAGFTQIAVVGVNEDKLRKLDAAIQNSLGPETAARVSFFLPDAFLEYLRKLPSPEPAGPKAKTVRGYKVKSVYDSVSPEEVKAKEEQMIRLMGEMMRKKKKP